MVNRTHRSGRRIVAALAATSCAALTVALLSPAQAAPSEAKRHYIVMTKTDPLVTYDGGVKGFAAKAVKDAVKNNPRAALAREYSQHLTQEHNDALAEAGIAKSAKTDDFTIAFNGFTAELTPSQVAELEKSSDVVHVWKDEKRYADTVTTPDFLGMTGKDGVWAKYFNQGQANAGATTIIGVIDSGIWPENPSFASNPLSARAQAVIDAKWKGGCESGEEEPVTCNDKLIGARYYTQGNTVEDFEFVSPRDYNGHGSHTAGTAGGNGNVKMSINGGDVGVGSGMAPAARIAAYKVLWATPDGRASGSTAAIVAAIDDAVADGVDVINYSVSGSSQYIVSPDEIGFLNAAASGVFISASAGNSGDTGPSTVAHNSPWDMTVAASTHSRGAANKVKLGNGAEYAAVGATDTGVGPAPLVNSTAVGLAGRSASDVQLCVPDADGISPLDPAKVTGKIVVCTRGFNARVEKSQMVKAAGGVGMILANASDAQSLNGDFHIIPTAHVNATDGAAIKAYAATDGATATITARDKAPVRAPEMAGFSSSGPALAAEGDLLKPDITAPGVDVIAAVSPAGNEGNDFNAYSGTSMSAPHIAGLAALMMQKNPTWSPMWVKSAMMTTATTLDNQKKPIQRSGANATPLDYGNGHVVPIKAYDPGLVYDNGVEDWIKFGCGIDQFQLVTAPAFCEKYGRIAPSQLNYPSISVAALAGSESVTRTVTNITNKSSVYTPKVTAPAGFKVNLSTSRFQIGAGETRSFTVTFTRTTAPMNKWAFGSLVWVDQRGHEVRSSLAVEPVAVSAPSEVAVSGVTGSKALEVTAGYTGKLNANVAGLVPAEVTVTPTTLDKDSETELTVPAGTKVLRIATYDADYPANTDLDLEVYNGDGDLVGSSGSGTAEESVTLEGEDLGGTYYVVADFYSGEGDSLDIAINTFALGDAAAGNMTVSPESQNVTTAKQATVTVAWKDLKADSRYLGAVNYSDGSASIGRTLVSVN